MSNRQSHIIHIIKIKRNIGGSMGHLPPSTMRCGPSRRGTRGPTLPTMRTMRHLRLKRATGRGKNSPTPGSWGPPNGKPIRRRPRRATWAPLGVLCRHTLSGGRTSLRKPSSRSWRVAPANPLAGWRATPCCARSTRPPSGGLCATTPRPWASMTSPAPS